MNLRKGVFDHYNSDELLFAFTMLVFTRFFSFILLPGKVYKILEITLIIFLLILVLLRPKKCFQHDSSLEKYSIFLIVLPFLSLIPSVFVHGQNVVSGVYMLRLQLMPVVFLFLQRSNIRIERLEKMIVWFSCIWASILLIQQLTYPRYLFALRGDDYFSGITIERRNGIYRFSTSGITFAFIGYFLLLRNFTHRRGIRPRDFSLFFLVLLGIYAYMTRQIIAGTLLASTLYFLLNKSRAKVIVFVIYILMLGVVVSKADAIFGDLIEKTQDDLYYNSRIEAYKFYLFEYWKHPVTVFLGNGIAHVGSAYGQEMQEVKETLRMYRSDVGIVGLLNAFGAVYILAYISMFIHIIAKWRRIEPSLYCSFMIWTFITPMIVPVFTPLFAVGFYTLIYLINVDLNENNFRKSYE